MRLYKITYQMNTKVPDAKIIVTRAKWCGSEKEAASNRRNIRQMNGYVPNSVQTIKVNYPTKKSQIVDFLNIEIAK